ncbi:MAG: hypothetical protein R3A48_04920 [Polyangiales bacterium]
MRPLALAALVTLGCARPSPPPHSAPPEAPPAASATPPAADAGAPTVHPHLVLLRAIAGGEALDAHTDPSLGLLVVEHVEAGPGPGASATRQARRDCGARIAADRGAVELIRAALAQGESFPPDCERDVCTVPGMEFAPVYRFVFEGSRLTQILRLSEAALPAEALRARDAYVTSRVEDQRAHRCRPPAP